MKSANYFVFVTLMLAFTASVCRGQYYFKHYQVDNGLVHNSVTSVMQDSRGFIWIGTRGGLNRFDGCTFKTYLNKNNTFGSIGDNIITAITEDKKAMIWIGTAKGIFAFDVHREVLTEIEVAPHGYISHLVVDEANNLWFLADGFLYKYDQEKKKLKKLKIKASCIAVDHQGRLWIGNDDGIISIYHIKKGSIKSVRVVSQKTPGDERSISKIYPVNDSLVLVGCFNQGLKSFDTKTEAIKSIPLENDKNISIYIRDITLGDDQKYWVATESGIYIYDLAAKTSVKLKKRLGDPYSISDNAVYALCKDSQHGIWAGTYFGGLNYYAKQNARFEKYYPLPEANSISGNAIGQILSDKNGNLWIGTEDAGINKFDLKTKKFTHYTATQKKDVISYPNIHGLLAVGHQLFIGPFFHGMEIMDMRTGFITRRFRFIGNKDDQISDFATCFYLTKDSTLLVGTSYRGSGLFIYNPKLQTFKRIQQIPYNSYVFDIMEDRKGTIWTGSVAQGTFYYNPKTGRRGNIRFGEKVKNRVVNEFPVRDIFEDSKGSIWFATTGGGLIKLDADGKKMKRFTVKNGLPSNIVWCILEDSAKHLWISTLKGLVRLDLNTGQTTIFTRSNGLISDQFNNNAAYKHTDGRMFFGGIEGMIAFHPSEFDRKDTTPPTYITGFQINNAEIAPGERHSPLSKSILYTDTMVLKYDQNNFSIAFAALDYSSPEVIRYKYRMKGIDKRWTRLSSNRQAYFTDLAPGNYEFSVQAKSNIGSWVGKEKKLFIIIVPPFWKSQIAYLLYFFFIVAVLYLSVRFYLRHLERQNLRKLQLFEHEKEKEVYQAKIEFFTNIAHEIRTPLTLIAGPIEWLMQKFGDKENVKKSLLIAQRNARRLIELTGQLLDFRKTETAQFSLNFVNTDITTLLTDVTTGFQQEAINNNIRLDIKLPQNPLVAFVDREALMKICSNLISNAIKYAATETTVQMEQTHTTDTHFSILFCNDGKGIPEEFRDKIFEPFFRVKGSHKPGTGIGLSLAASLTELHNGSLQLISGNPDQIIFELKLPIHQKFEFQLSSWKKIK